MKTFQLTKQKLQKGPIKYTAIIKFPTNYNKFNIHSRRHILVALCITMLRSN